MLKQLTRSAISRRHRRLMRGYARLRSDGRLIRIEDALCALADTELGVTGYARHHVFGSATPIAEKVVRQYLLLQLGGAPLKAKLLSNSPAKALVHPLPAPWRDTLKKEGFEVSSFRCAVMWMLYLLGMVGYALLAMAKSFLLSFRRPDRDLGKSAYFDGLSAAQLPRQSQPSYDIFSWYASWTGRAPNVQALSHSVSKSEPREAGGLSLIYVSQPQPLPKGSSNRLKLIREYAILTFLTLMDVCRGRWWHALLLREAERAALIKVAAKEDIPIEFMMSNSGWLYRPLWTYAAEAVGSRISFYFYSTNAAVFKTASGYPRQTNHWELCTWSRYLVWAEGQADFLRRQGIHANIDIVGPIWFSDTDAALPEFVRPAVAVFDVQPMREAMYRALALRHEYYTSVTGSKFIEDICKASKYSGTSVLLKRKRNIGKNVHPNYARTIEKRTTDGSVIPVEPGLAAQHIIREANCVVSMPFTSTAHLARSMGKPSCYYDPTGLVQPDDRSAYGIEILNSEEALKDWIASKAVI